jgi:hypothetical protein
VFRKWEQSTVYWEQAYRCGHTIATAELEVRKYKSHRDCANVRMLGAGGRTEIKKRGRRKGDKGARRQNVHLWAQIAGGQDGKTVDLSEETELVPKPEHKDMARQLALLFDDTDSTIHRLVHVGWNPESKQMMGWFYNVTERDTMPKLGGYLDLEGCEYAAISDILEMRRDYLKMHEAEREKHGTNTKSWEQMDGHERNDCQMFQKQAQMRELVKDGKMTFEKYRKWVDKLRTGFLITSADEEGDLSAEEEDDDEDDDDFDFERLMQEQTGDGHESENEAEQEQDAANGEEQGPNDSSYDGQYEARLVRNCRRRI